MAVRKLVFSSILLALIAFKVSLTAIHISFHHGQDGNLEGPCELCEQALTVLNAEFSTTEETQVFEGQYKVDYHQQVKDYESVCAAQFFDDTLFGRPPPTLI